MSKDEYPLCFASNQICLRSEGGRESRICKTLCCSAGFHLAIMTEPRQALPKDSDKWRRSQNCKLVLRSAKKSKDLPSFIFASPNVYFAFWTRRNVCGCIFKMSDANFKLSLQFSYLCNACQQFFTPSQGNSDPRHPSQSQL